MKKILIFGKYFGYYVGGAEKSIFELLKQEEEKGAEITVLMVQNLKTFNSQNLKINFPMTWKINYINFNTDSIRFKYYHYFKNKIVLQEYFSNLSNNYEVWSYGFYAPVAINSYKGKTVYLARDEFALGWDNNYYKGIKYFVKEFYKFIEKHYYYKWKNELFKSINKSHLIANSQFIKNELYKISKSNNIDLFYSFVDRKSLLKDFSLIRNQTKKGIVLIGDNAIKGNDIVKKIARLMKNEQFYIFDRMYDKEKIVNNITYMPWQPKSVDVYKYAKIVLVPSRCHEAFARTIIEAQILDIPVLCSNKGGNIEAIDNIDHIINNLENIDEWRKKIENLI